MGCAPRCSGNSTSRVDRTVLGPQAPGRARLSPRTSFLDSKQRPRCPDCASGSSRTNSAAQASQAGPAATGGSRSLSTSANTAELFPTWKQEVNRRVAAHMRSKSGAGGQNRDRPRKAGRPPPAEPRRPPRGWPRGLPMPPATTRRWPMRRGPRCAPPKPHPGPRRRRMPLPNMFSKVLRPSLRRACLNRHGARARPRTPRRAGCHASAAQFPTPPFSPIAFDAHCLPPLEPELPARPADPASRPPPSPGRSGNRPAWRSKCFTPSSLRSPSMPTSSSFRARWSPRAKCVRGSPRGRWRDSSNVATEHI